MKSSEELKAYNRQKVAESRAKKKAHGLPLNNQKVTKEAQKKYLQSKKALKFTLSPEEYNFFETKANELGLSKIELFRELLKKV